MTTKPRTRPSLTADPEPIITSTHVAAAAAVDAHDTTAAAPADEPAQERGGSRTRAARPARDPLSGHRRLVDVAGRTFAAKVEKLAAPAAELADVLAGARAAGMSPERAREILAVAGVDVDALRAMADEITKHLD